MQETILSSENIYRGRIVNLDVHQVQLPNGQTAARELIQHPGAVAIVALDEDQNLTLIRQFRLGSAQVMIELPAGGLEPGEDPTACAIRELQEEAGLKPNHITKIAGWYVAPGYTTEYIHLFVATNLVTNKIDGDDDEFIEVFSVPFSEAIEMVNRGEIENSTAVAGILRTAQYLQLG